MNYLAHCFLSGQNEQIVVGNFIGDFVKGNNHQKYPKHIQQGILLHRFIDSYTDKSEITKASKQYFQPVYGLYSGIITDVIYDHFLSIHWKYFSHFSREQFIFQTYKTLQKYYAILPYRGKKLLPSIIHHNWMRYYASFYGLEKVLLRMSKRTSLPKESKNAIVILKENYTNIELQFLTFFEKLLLEVETFK